MSFQGSLKKHSICPTNHSKNMTLYSATVPVHFFSGLGSESIFPIHFSIWISQHLTNCDIHLHGVGFWTNGGYPVSPIVDQWLKKCSESQTFHFKLSKSAYISEG